MEVKIDKLILPIFHKTKMGDMNLLWDYGNSLRIMNGKKPLDLDHYLRSKETLEFIIELEKDFNSAESALLKLAWNKASNEQLEHRDKLLIEVITFLERGFIKDDKALLKNIS